MAPSGLARARAAVTRGLPSSTRRFSAVQPRNKCRSETYAGFTLLLLGPGYNACVRFRCFAVVQPGSREAYLILQKNTQYTLNPICRARVPTNARLPSTPGLERLSHHDSLLGVRMARRLGNRRRHRRVLNRHRIHLRRVRGAYRVP